MRQLQSKIHSSNLTDWWLRLSVALVLALCSLPDRADAEEVSRERVLRRAAEHPKVRASEAAVARARALKSQADSLRWPLFSIEAGVGPSIQAELVDGTAVQSQTDVDELGVGDLSVAVRGRVSLVQPIHTFGKIANRQEAASLGIEAREHQRAAKEDSVALEGVELYEGYLFARDAEKFFEEVEHVLDRSIQSTSSKLEKKRGSVSESDLLRLQAALGAAQVAHNRASAARRRAEAGLRAYFGLAQDKALEPADDSLQPLDVSSPDARRLVDRALGNRPELGALNKGASALTALARAEDSGNWPTFAVVGSLSGVYTPGREFIETTYVVDPLNNFIPTIGVGLRWQLQGGMADARADEKRAAAEKLSRMLEWAKDGIPAQVRDSYEEVERARKDIERLEEVLGHTKKWLVRANADYAVGLAPSREVTDAVEAYATARTALLDARYRFNIRLARLARAAGSLEPDGSLYPGASQ